MRAAVIYLMQEGSGNLFNAEGSGNLFNAGGQSKYILMPEAEQIYFNARRQSKFILMPEGRPNLF